MHQLPEEGLHPGSIEVVTVKEAPRIIPRAITGNARGRIHLSAPRFKKKLHLDGYIPDQIQSGKNSGKFRDKYVTFELNIEDMVTLRNYINWLLEREE